MIVYSIYVKRGVGDVGDEIAASAYGLLAMTESSEIAN